MLDPRSVRNLAMVVACCFLTLPTFGQTTEGQQHAKVSEITECEGVNNCGTWNFIGRTGQGTWPDGEQANLEVTKIENNQILITRTDVVGSKAGLTAVYTGNRNNSVVVGTYSGSFENQAITGGWYWVSQAESNVGLKQLTECEGDECKFNPGQAVTWKFNGMEGVGSFGTGNQPLTIERLDSKTILVQRVDTTGNWRWSAVYTGVITGNRVQGTVRYHDPQSNSFRNGVWSGIIGDTATGTSWALSQHDPNATPPPQATVIFFGPSPGEVLWDALISALAQ